MAQKRSWRITSVKHCSALAYSPGFVSVPEQLVSRHACSLVVEITEIVLVPTDERPINIREMLLLSVEDYSENYSLNPDGGGR